MVDQYKKLNYPLHVLINNAGIQAPTGHRGEHTKDGIEITFASNYYGPLYLTELLLPIMKKTPPAGGITESASASFGAEHYHESDWWQYARTKLFNLMAVREESRRLEPDHIDVVAAHPGMAVTDHFGKADTEHKLSSWMIETWANSPIGQTKEQGAIALEYAGVSPDVNGKNGWYVGTPELGLVNVGNAHIKEHPNAPLANNPEACRRFYNKTLAILKQSDPSFEPASGPIEQSYVISI
ncbi:probable WW domain-containing oxidoreductase [Coccomyxa sp. Obi]|nr:probable WW domain-containing oxidoreductase [Coccomyxa sp. Obi]